MASNAVVEAQDSVAVEREEQEGTGDVAEGCCADPVLTHSPKNMGSCPGSRSGSIAFSPRDELNCKAKGAECSPIIQRVNREESPDLVCTGEPAEGESEYGSVREGRPSNREREPRLEEETKCYSPQL